MTPGVICIPSLDGARITHAGRAGRIRRERLDHVIHWDDGGRDELTVLRSVGRLIVRYDPATSAWSLIPCPRRTNDMERR